MPNILKERLTAPVSTEAAATATKPDRARTKPKRTSKLPADFGPKVLIGGTQDPARSVDGYMDSPTTGMFGKVT